MPDNRGLCCGKKHRSGRRKVVGLADQDRQDEDRLLVALGAILGAPVAAAVARCVSRALRSAPGFPGGVAHFHGEPGYTDRP